MLSGLTMYGQMTAGSWIYIGTQGILQGTYQTFAAAAEKHFGGSLAGRIVLTAGLGGMGGAQPLAVTMNGGVALCVEVDAERIGRRLETAYLDRSSELLDEALGWAEEAARPSAGAVHRPPGQRGRRAARAGAARLRAGHGHRPDLGARHAQRLRAQRHALRAGAGAARERSRTSTRRRAVASIVEHVAAMVALQRAGAHVFDYGNNIRGVALEAGYADAFSFQGFVPLYIRPLFCRGNGPFRWVALSGDPADIARTDRAVLEALPDNAMVTRWMRMAPGKVHFQGLPARICWLEYGERAKVGVLFNELVARGEVKAPIVIGRDHLDSGSVASPYRETEGMRDGSDAIADWPLLNAMLERGCRRQLGVASTTAAAWASARASTPAWWWSPTARRRWPSACSACSPPTRAPASCATPTPATPKRSPPRASKASTCP